MDTFANWPFVKDCMCGSAVVKYAHSGNGTLCGSEEGELEVCVRASVWSSPPDVITGTGCIRWVDMATMVDSRPLRTLSVMPASFADIWE